MGEHEQGGMLRNVVVLGLIALIASVVTLLVVNLTTHMKTTTHQATNALEKVPKPYVLGNPDASFKDYELVPGTWQGEFNRLPQVGPIPSHNWREMHFNVNPNQDFHGAIDLNVFVPKGQGDADTIGKPASWNDAYSKVDMQVWDLDTNKMVSHNESRSGADLKAGHHYQYLIKFYNAHAFTLLDHTAGANNQSSFISQSNGKAVSYTITDFEAATYEDD